ncbi:DRTGG domain protein [Gloeothece citriformis PCC 7424]|uniref:DRTGG domain protein n=1 Tax=Gloeothece citriformis (strain PCC 7424) TaxID=65393 RepID=B7KE52_GLOC7|nr:phosphotransacetylase family protein [Gloeothece citriformis]ACK71750.1 DRTGG domain protein [Gloeothece citriformis PCC 7424]
MAQSAKCLLIGSVEAYSGKSGTILGLAHQLQQQGRVVAYGKPLGTCLNFQETEMIDEDVEFVRQSLGLSSGQVRSPLIYLDETTIHKRLHREDTTDYTQAVTDYLQQLEGEIILIEGAGTLWEGSLFDLSLPKMASLLEADVLIVVRYTSPLVVESLLKVKRELGDRLMGVVINDLPPDQLETIQDLVNPYLENEGIPVLGMLPKSNLLRSVSVRQLAQQLKADVLCRSDRLDLMVEKLTIGAMNVNAALEFFRQGQNMAVVTGGDRTELQLAALETSTSCLILTGHIAPDPLILTRAEDLEIPILSVQLDTLTTVEIVDQAFGKVRLQEQIKVDCIQEMMKNYFDIDRLMQKLNGSM